MRFEVEVKFGRDFIEVEGNRIIVGVKAKPKHGKANMEIIKKIAKYFKVSSSNVRIIAGFTSRKKIVEISLRR